MACAIVVSLTAHDAFPGALADEAGVLTGRAAFGAWSDDAPGRRRLIRPADLPAQPARSSAEGSSIVARPDSAMPRLPPGFTATIAASGLSHPRILRVAANGDVFIAESSAGRMTVLRPDGSKSVFARGLDRPYGIAFWPPGPSPRFVYVGEAGQVVRFAYATGDSRATSTPEVIVANLPANGNHWTRDLAVAADGKRLFVAVGSASNVAEQIAAAPPNGTAAWDAAHGQGAAWGSETGRAEILSFDPDGRNLRIYATGLRNCSGLAVQPAGGALWCAVNERDGLGDNLPTDYATHVEPGGFYGWPWFYIGNHPDPRPGSARPDLAALVKVPDVLIQAHSAPLGIAFYDGTQFPKSYFGDAFVALHGSWNRATRTGYKVVRLRMHDGKATGEYDDFMTGMVANDRGVWARPVGVAVAADGSLLVSEDANGTIWRVTYRDPA